MEFLRPFRSNSHISKGYQAGVPHFELSKKDSSLKSRFLKMNPSFCGK
ncbi:hypothetical protein LEP1GSC036_2414 [Leptospira weilii str. 2006001853]|uniref:Uncharacterized protein n=1 Tax=Leptospira weilii str. 2006001853 TaxID=1001589 RepID=A0A828YXJ6_9LEPT|nr:hypothetical protein LEP1GSC036_2414 [Leptospira weilii str. 2006001853]EMN45181.1 hypothetical protein LEP1GSC086_1261 [Leptospira weilii str. LNT 1234]